MGRKFSRPALTIFLITLVGLSLLITGCAGKKNKSKEDMEKPFIGGNVALDLYLQKGLPPAVVHDNGKFPFGVGLFLENVGEADIGPGTENPYAQVRLEGILPSNFGTTESDLVKNLDSSLKGARKNFDGSILPGESTTVTFEPLNYQQDLKGNYPVTIRALACYDYKTTATAQICVKSDVIETQEDSSICTLTGEKNPQNSGSPIHVSSLVENPMGENKVQVNFIVEHVGSGDFYGRESGENCDPSVRNTNRYEVDVNVLPFEDPDTSISCNRFEGGRSGSITLYQGSPTTVTCTIEQNSDSDVRIYQDVMTIELKYRYGEFIEQQVVVQDVSNN